VLHIDTQQLPFEIDAQVRYLRLTILAGLYAESGGFVAGREVRVSYALKPDSFARLSEGQNLGIIIPAPPGQYRLRFVIQEQRGGKIAAFTRPVEIRAS
jgi:hypothetical protein